MTRPSEAGARPSRGPSSLVCVLLGTLLGSGLGVLSAFAALDRMAEYFWPLAAVFGGVLGFVVSPVLIGARGERGFFARVGLSVGLGACVVVAASYGLQLGVLPVGIAVVGTFYGSAGLFAGRVGQALGRIGLALALAFGTIAVFAYLDRLPDDEASLIALLGDNDSARAGRAAARLKEVGGSAPFVKALRHPDPRVRESAARGMWVYPRADVEPALREAARDEHSRVRVAALGTLFHMGIEQPLLAALSDPDPFVRGGLVLRVSYCGDASHVAALEALFDDPDPGVRETARQVAERLRP